MMRLNHLARTVINTKRKMAKKGISDKIRQKYGVDAISGAAVSEKYIRKNDKTLADFGVARGYLTPYKDGYEVVSGEERSIPATKKNNFAKEFLKDYLNHPASKNKLKSMLGLDSADTEARINEMTKNISSIHQADRSLIPGNTYVSSSAYYKPWSHSVVSRPEDAVHENMHGSGAAPVWGENDITKSIDKIIEKDPKVLKGKDNYYHSPEEIYSRLMQWRFDNGVKPDEVMDEERVKKTRGNYDSGAFLDHLDDKTAAELHNKLATTTPKGKSGSRNAKILSNRKKPLLG